jgi:extracellular elastinolytic metalloproteinase
MSALPSSRPLGRRARRLAGTVAAGAVVLTTALASTTLASAQSAESTAPASARPGTPERAAGRSAEARGHYDARYIRSGAAKAMEYRAASKAAGRGATKAFAKALPAKAILDIDGTTGTVRMLAKLDGYLTGKSNKKATTVALKYVRGNHAALGLTTGDLKTFKLKREYVDIEGVHHLYWIQRIAGQTVFGNGLTAAVAKDGRLLTLGGSPVSKATLASPADLEIDSPGAAIADARRRLDAAADSRASASDSAQRVLFVTARGSHHAWLTTVMSVSQPATQVVDAASGRLLYRNPLGNDAAPGEAIGQVFRNFPGAKRGGTYVPVNFTRQGWLPRGASRLKGNNSHTYSDVDDNNEAGASEEIHDFNNKLVPFNVKGMSFCKKFPCSWNPDKPFSWRTNREQNGTQVFYFVNRFHDHLLAKPIGFTEAAGNFEHVNTSKNGKARDAVQTQTMDGASTANGLPDANHVDNANMNTPPDGTPPTMQMYLQHSPGTSYPAGDPFPANNTGDEAVTVYHEYVHGLSNRLVVDVLGNSTLGPVQGDAMGEAWSDWYAADSLVSDGLEVDRKGKADLDLFLYDGAGAPFIRTEGIDCTPKSPESRCPGGQTGHAGGYTYRDYGRIFGVPEVHADGEIWGQTLWSLRDKVGSRVSRSLVTRAMELAPANPSFLDMRNALLVADTAHFKGRYHNKIWSTFASRGMGFFAGTIGGDDASPAADAHRPPKTLSHGLLTGTVKDNTTGQPIAGVPVTLAFQGTGLVNPTVVTAADGSYTLGPVPAGSYGKLTVNGAGYQPISTPVTVAQSGSKADFLVTRDWVAVSGGAKVIGFNGPDYTEFGCGPVHALDTSLATGWGSTTGDRKGTPTNVFKPKFLTVDIGRKINITGFAVDPSATCGDAGSASTGAYRIDTSPDNVNWTVAASGTFVAEDRGRLNNLTPITGTLGVQYVKFVILGNQVPNLATDCPNGGFDGCTYTDLTELQVYGVATP